MGSSFYNTGKIAITKLKIERDVVGKWSGAAVPQQFNEEATKEVCKGNELA